MTDDDRAWGSDHDDKLLERMERIAAQDAAAQLIGGIRGDQQRRHGWTRPADDVVLAFEEKRPGHTGDKENAIRLAFGLPAARYYQIVNAAIDKPEALEHHPMLVNRLRENREARVKARASRTFRRTR